MAWLERIFGGRRRREVRRALEEEVRRLLAEHGPAAAWRALDAGLAHDPDPTELFHLAGQVLRAGGESAAAELFDRAADAPHDLERLLELGSHLLNHEQPDTAAVVLERALAFAPFDAVVRSELAIAHARAGRPRRVVETLALHPCLADDPGALFQFAWASLLSGDLDAAEGSLGELSGAPTLRAVLEHALSRARLGTAEPPDARDFLFIEHGSLLLDAEGPLGGRYDALHVDAERAGALVARAGAALRALVPAPRRVVAHDDRLAALADAVASACDGAVVPPGKGRVPSAILVLDRAEHLQTLGRENLERGGPLVLALTMELGRTLPRTPDFVGAFARSSTFSDDALASRGPTAPALDPSLATFLEARRAWLPPNDAHPRTAYVPDAPLPR